jgi:hypothetical protein
VNLQSGILSKSFVKTAFFFSWCVRGGQGVDPNDLLRAAMSHLVAQLNSIAAFKLSRR